MATTTLLQRHAGEGETIAEAIRDCLDYGKDPEKTESGKYISAYECDPATVADEFLLAKASYAAMTGREQKKANDVLCYQIRQSFYPGEITPKEANRIGYELAMRWTKGRHAFIVTTHSIHQIASWKYRKKLQKCSKSLIVKRRPTGCVHTATKPTIPLIGMTGWSMKLSLLPYLPMNCMSGK